MDDETPREKFAGYFGMFVTLIPALFVSGFFPEWDVLPNEAWFAIATVGAGVAGAIAAPLWPRGAVAGALAGAGILLGIWAYVAVRGALTGHHTFLSIELIIGAGLGALPGLILYSKWASAKNQRPEEPRGA
jgi:hypothetical protein